MKALGTAMMLLGAVTLMLAIIVAQRDYQRNWSARAVAQTDAVGAAMRGVPERIAEASSRGRSQEAEAASEGNEYAGYI